MKSVVVSLLLLFCISVNAQKLIVEKFDLKTNDVTARTHPRQDINGNDCALIKVQLAAPNAIFDGNVIGDVAYETSIYMVYMSQGSKRLTVRLEGYLPLEVNFEDFGIKSLESKTVYILTISGIIANRAIEPVRKMTGWIVINSKPSGATVYINDEFVGNTPLTNYKQAYGKYTYRVEYPNYHSSSGTIELNSGKIERNIELKPAFGTISITSNVAGANVLLDGKATNKLTPCTLEEIPSGQHTIIVQKDKYSPVQQSFNIEDGKTTPLSISLDARFAIVSINSPDGAEIYSNGNYLGKTKFSGELMEGYYDIEVRMAHHKTVTNQILVTAGQDQVINLNPLPIYGALDVITTPHNAEVFVDGLLVGKTPCSIEKLLEGEHSVKVIADGFIEEQKDVIIKEEETTSISFTLRKEDMVDNSQLFPESHNKMNTADNVNAVAQEAKKAENEVEQLRRRVSSVLAKARDTKNESSRKKLINNVLSNLNTLCIKDPRNKKIYQEIKEKLSLSISYSNTVKGDMHYNILIKRINEIIDTTPSQTTNGNSSRVPSTRNDSKGNVIRKKVNSGSEEGVQVKPSNVKLKSSGKYKEKENTVIM